MVCSVGAVVEMTALVWLKTSLRVERRLGDICPKTIKRVTHFRSLWLEQGL